MINRETDEKQCLQASLKGNPQAFEGLVLKYQSLVCAITYSATGNVAQSEELAQDVFLKAWKNLRQLQDLGKFRPWLCRIARTTVQNWFRSRQRDTTQQAAPLEAAWGTPSAEPDPAERAMRHERETLVGQALSQLPESQREVLVLYYREHQSMAEVANQLDLTEVTVRQRISRARQALREQMLSFVEETLTDTRPSKAFATGVIASITALGLKSSTVTAATAFKGTSMGTLNAVTVKLSLVAAGLIILAGGWVVSQRFRSPQETNSSRIDTQISTNIASPNESVLPVETPPLMHNQVVSPPVVRDINKPSPLGSDSEEVTSEASPPEDSYVFKPKGLLSGLITDAETGEPIPNALVRISKSRIFDTHTDSHGFYSFTKIHEGGNFDIAVDIPSHIGIRWTGFNPKVQLTPDEQRIKHFSLPRACQVALSVVDANGIGIGGAKVIATSLAGKYNDVVAYFGETRITDPNGTLLYGGFEPAEAEYLITVFHQQRFTRKKNGRLWGYTRLDYAPAKALIQLSEPGRIVPLTVVLQKGEPVHGYVEYADGVPATDVEVVARPAWWHCSHSSDAYPVQKDGTFTLDHITPGSYEICAKYPHLETGGGGSTHKIFTTHLPLEDGEALTVKLPNKSPQSLVAISGRLLIQGGKVPRFVDIRAYNPITRKRGRASIWEDNGHLPETFIMDRLEPGTYDLTFTGDEVATKQIKQVEAPCSDLIVELTYLQDPILTGNVTALETNDPIKQFKVRARKLESLHGSYSNQDDNWVDFNNPDGAFSFEVVGPGVYQLQVQAPGYAPTWSKSISTDHPAPVTITLSRGGRLNGTVVDASGREISDAQVIPLSLACGLGHNESERFVTTIGATQSMAGQFTLPNLPAGTETVKVIHPDYAPAVKTNINIIEGETTHTDIVLNAGGTVEGIVHDHEGHPQANTPIHFFPGDHQGQDLAGCLLSVTTDKHGYYRAKHLPEQWLRVRRGNPLEFQLGVQWQTVRPKNGVIMPLDIGGSPIIKGRFLLDDRPLANNKLTLVSPGTAYQERFECTAETDALGYIIFRGIIPGSHLIYCQDPNSQSMLKIATIDMGSDDLDLGVIHARAKRLYVTLEPRAGQPSWDISGLYLSQGPGVAGAFKPLAYGRTPTYDGGPWTLNNVQAGSFWLTITRNDNVQWKTLVELAADRHQWDLSLPLPSVKAQLSGQIHGAIPAQGLILQSKDQTLTTTIHPQTTGHFNVGQLPAGHYTLGTTLAWIYSLPKLVEFQLGEGENRKLPLIDLGDKPAEQVVNLSVQVLDQNHGPVPNANVELEGPLGRTSPILIMRNSYTFFSCPGDHQLLVHAPGYASINQTTNLKASQTSIPTPQRIVIHLMKQE